MDTLHGGASLVTYNLKAVVSHIGDKISGGHYIATTRLDASSDSWHTYSDSFCKAISSEQVQKQQAYLLFYEKDNSVREEIGGGILLNTIPLSDIHYDLTDKQISKLCLSKVQNSNAKLLGGIGSNNNPREKTDIDDKPISTCNQTKNQHQSSNAIQDPSSEILPPTQSTTNVQRPRNRRLRKNVSRVEQNQDNQQHSTTPITTTSTAEPSKKRKRQNPDTKPALPLKRKPPKKKKSQWKNKAGRDYKREN